MQSRRIAIWVIVGLLWLITVAMAVGFGYEWGWETNLNESDSPQIVQQ